MTSVDENGSSNEEEKVEYLLRVEERVSKFEILVPVEKERSTVVGTRPSAPAEAGV
jgi:hypothetical protein